MITTIDRRVIYTGDGIGKTFAYTFKVHADSHLVAYVDGVSVAITSAGRNADQEASPGGTVDLTAIPANGSTVVIVREMPETQTTDYTPYGSFPSESHEARLDEIVMSVQEHSDELSRAIIASDEDDGTTDFTMPPSVANKVIGWNAAGDGLINVTADSALFGLDDQATGIVLTLTDALISMVKPLALAAGLAATPSLVTAGDLDTGIWFPAANTIAISTAGVEAMRIDSGSNSTFKGNITIENVGGFLSYSQSSIERARISLLGAGTDGGSLRFFTKPDAGALAQVLTIDSNGHIIFPSVNDAATPTLAFGDGDTGFYEAADDTLRVTLGGNYRWQWVAQEFRSNNANGPALANLTSSSSVPTVYPNNSDPNTGLGWNFADQLSLIAGGIEGLRISEASGIAQVGINQSTNDAPFIDFQATIDADATSAISSLTTSGAVTHHIQFEINGTTFWIAGSTTDPT